MGTRWLLAAFMSPHLLCDVLAWTLGWRRAVGVRGSGAESRAVLTLHELQANKGHSWQFFTYMPVFSCTLAACNKDADSKMAQSICTGWLCREQG